MTKISLKIFLLTLILVSTSCKKDLDSLLELEADYKVIDLEYGFDNYMRNIRDKSEQLIIKQRNIVLIYVDKNGETTIEDNFIPDSLIISEFKKYITPNPTDEKMPMTTEKSFQYSGKVNTHKNITILVKYHKELNYEKYQKIRNKFYLAYNEVRNDFSMSKFNKSLTELLNSNEQEDIIKWQEIRQIFPIRYMESLN
ncbi:hypothetical protein [Seonamhaeicola aphaedonensis]|uniref:Lipoprotein n=1 Tax=Seonamhaeicola aphaedonensis TaxID=1461338 RepID=A0A3D9HHK9_9FLAO|nr:hypothetical protein [Seonamhaeicola aphaedonensis]RED48446.1 hypothetical protein DFQ02_104292 [Seonamhaeicola aphaedonensis]